jgi:hypothetical protein
LDSNRFAVLYRNEKEGVEWEEFEFSGDSQSMTKYMTVVSGTYHPSRSRSKLSMDCLGKVSASQPDGQCAITWTYEVNSPTKKEIYISFMDEMTLIPQTFEIGSGSGNQLWNSMVVLTDQDNFVISFMTVNYGK